jgi:5'-nucleotidase
VVMARNQIMRDALPTLVLSGVNRGLNAAEDVTYSGTIAGAMEATLLGIPAICLSQAFRNRNDVKWQTAERYGPDLLARLIAHGWPVGTFLNVNFPPVDPDEVKGVKITCQGQRGQSSLQITDRIDARGFPYYWLHLDHEKAAYPEDTDLAALDAGYISVTPLQLDLTNHAAIDSLHAALA